MQIPVGGLRADKQLQTTTCNSRRRYNRSMIKGITLVTQVASAAALEKLASLLGALGFEPGKGWEDGSGRGAAFLAPLGNLELVAGRAPAVPPILIEVTQLDQVRAVVEAVDEGQLHGRDWRTAVRGCADALEVAAVYGRAGPIAAAWVLGVGEPAAGQAHCRRRRSVGGGNEVCDCGGALERGDHRSAAAGRAGWAAAHRRGARPRSRLCAYRARGRSLRRRGRWRSRSRWMRSSRWAACCAARRRTMRRSTRRLRGASGSRSRRRVCRTASEC